MKVVTIIQARMGSTRLPGKVLKDLGGRTVLERVVRRAQKCRLADEVVVATSVEPANDAIAEECTRLRVRVLRGSEDDLLDRYFRAAEVTQADVVVRITSDCPLVDPGVSDESIRAFLETCPDYASNVLERTYPRGLDTEVFSLCALDRAFREAKDPFQREHVTPFFYQHPERFKLVSVKGERDFSNHRWTLDTPEDLEFLQAVYARLGDRDFTWRDVLSLVESEPRMAEINKGVVQKTG
jgi:spore coat polysaccharide biosynthesis protein SpsF